MVIKDASSARRRGLRFKKNCTTFERQGRSSSNLGGPRQKTSPPGPRKRGRKRKKRPENHLPGTHMRVLGTADVLDQVEQKLQRANIPELRVRKSKWYRPSEIVAQRV